MEDPQAAATRTRRAALTTRINEHLRAVQNSLNVPLTPERLDELRRRGDILLADVAYCEWLEQLEAAAVHELGE